MAIYVLTNDDRELLKSKTVLSLPDNPSAKGIAPSQVKMKMSDSSLLLFNWVKATQENVNTFISAQNSENNTIKANITTLQGYFTRGKANSAIADGNGSNIVSTYETKTDATSKFNTNKGEIDKIKDGTTVVKKAQQDESGNNIKATYGNYLTHSLQSNSTQMTFKVTLYSKDGTKLDEESQVFGSATTSYSGLLSAEDKVKINSIASDMATALASAESYTDSKVARANLVSVIGEATQSLSGLMSDTDKGRLDALYALLGTEADDDNIVDTINEILAIFDQYPEGADLVSQLALKANDSEVVKLTTNQTITGTKTFEGDLKFKGVNISTIGQITTTSYAVKIGFGSINYITISNTAFYSNSNAQYDLGQSGQRWRDAYISRNITDGSNSVTVADLVNAKGLAWQDVSITEVD